MSRAVILIDFDNIYYKVEFSKEKLCMDFSALIDYSLGETADIDSVTLRLYDGWRKDARSTQKADRVSSVIEGVEAELFPIIRNKRKIFGEIVLATSQYGFDFEWGNTLSIKSGIHRLSLKGGSITDNQCGDDSHCPLLMISNASKGKIVSCPIDECKNVNFDKLVRNEQKMVDTMMTCDYLDFAIDKDFEVVAIVSDDVDVLPSLLLASKYKKPSMRLLYIAKNNWHLKQYDFIFSENNIISMLWE